MASQAVVVLLALAGSTVWADSSLRFVEDVRNGARIVSGWEAQEGQIPYQLSLRLVNDQGQVQGCGASIISDEWALTAAHCTALRVTAIIRAGGVDLARPYYIFESTEFYIHPSYNEILATTVQPDDVSLIKFGRQLKFNDRVQPIRIQREEDKDRNYDGVQFRASGWGQLWSQGSSPDVLNWVYLRGTTNAECRLAFGGSSIIQDSTVCARGYNDTTQSPCSGDSGGPLTAVDEDGKLTLVGVTSFVSEQGCHIDLPAGFCRPGYYHDWLLNVTGIDFSWDFEEETTTTEAEPETTPEPEAETTPEPEPETTTEIETTTEPEAETTTETEPETTTEPELETTPESETTEAEITTESETETPPEEVSTSEPELETTAEPVPTSEPELETDEPVSTTEPDSETTPETNVSDESDEVSGVLKVANFKYLSHWFRS